MFFLLAEGIITIGRTHDTLRFIEVNTVRSDILGKDAYEEYKTQIDYCVHDGLMMNVDDSLVITHKGFEHYGATFSLFYSKMEA